MLPPHPCPLGLLRRAPELGGSGALREFHCRAHRSWRDCYFGDLGVFDAAALRGQLARLGEERKLLLAAGKKAGRAGSSVGRNQRRTLVKQEERVRAALEGLLSAASGSSSSSSSGAPAAAGAWRCRTCGSDECDGLCFGMWKRYADQEVRHKNISFANDVFENAVVLGHHCVELWSFYGAHAATQEI